jgi:hypothetical protein
MFMSKAKTFSAQWRLMAFAGAFLLLFFLAGCGAEPTDVAVAPAEAQAATSAPTEPPAPTDTAAPTDTVAPTEPVAPTDTPLPTDTPAPTDTATPEVVDDSACVTCHTSQETLQALATEEEAPEVESEGEG